MSARQGKDRSASRDEATLAEVEAGIAAAHELPEDIATEVQPVELSDAEVGNTTRLRNAWIKVKQLEAGWKEGAREGRQRGKGPPGGARCAGD